MKLEHIKDPETLLSAAKLLDAENRRLLKETIALKQKIRELEGKEPAQLALELAELERQLLVRNKMLFGRSSEKRPKEGAPDQERAPQTGHGPRQQAQLSVIEQVHRLDDADRMCPQCGGNLTEWAGQFEESEEVDVLARSFVLVKHKRQKYRCSCASCVETASLPPRLVPGGRYSTNFAVSVAVAKYADHLPLERQVKIMKREGLLIDSQTLWNQIEALAALVAPVHAQLRAHVLSQSVIGADETHWLLMGKSEGTKRWQVWAVVSEDAVYYQLADSRSTQAARQLLGEYKGILLSDGYAAYEAVRKQGATFRTAHCWAHVRRKFSEIETLYPGPCKEILDLIGELYEIERDVRAGPSDAHEHHRQRQARSALVIKQIHRWALEVEALPQSALAKAVAYMSSMWNGLIVFLDEPNVSLDNNAVERALRGVVLGRKNHYGSRSERGTEVAAILYSLIESAKLVGVEPDDYLSHVATCLLNGETAPLPHEMKRSALGASPTLQ